MLKILFIALLATISGAHAMQKFTFSSDKSDIKLGGIENFQSFIKDENRAPADGKLYEVIYPWAIRVRPKYAVNTEVLIILEDLLIRAENTGVSTNGHLIYTQDKKPFQWFDSKRREWINFDVEIPVDEKQKQMQMPEQKLKQQHKQKPFEKVAFDLDGSLVYAVVDGITYGGQLDDTLAQAGFHDEYLLFTKEGEPFNDLNITLEQVQKMGIIVGARKESSK